MSGVKGQSGQLEFADHRKATGSSGIQRSLPGVQWTREVLLIKEARWLHIGTLSYLFFPSLNASRSQRPAGQRSAGSALPLLAALSPPPKGSRPRLALVSPRWSVGLRTSSYISEILMQYIDSSSVHHPTPPPHPPPSAKLSSADT